MVEPTVLGFTNVDAGAMKPDTTVITANSIITPIYFKFTVATGVYVDSIRARIFFDITTQ